MTSAYRCQSIVCRKAYAKVTFSEENGVALPDELGGWKHSCCHRCSNPKCPDHGECSCLDNLMNRMPPMSDELLQRLRDAVLENDEADDDEE